MKITPSSKTLQTKRKHRQSSFVLGGGKRNYAFTPNKKDVQVSSYDV